MAVHGTTTMYQYGCPCRDCLDAHNEYKRYRAAQIPKRVKNPDDSIHGTKTGYREGHCGCDKCMAQAIHDEADIRKLVRKMNFFDVMRVTRDMNAPVHGTEAGFENLGCRCEKCDRWSRQARIGRRYWPVFAVGDEIRYRGRSGVVSDAAPEDPGTYQLRFEKEDGTFEWKVTTSDKLEREN